ncbi:MAG: putative ABC-type ATPase [Arcticibacterium sp.]
MSKSNIKRIRMFAGPNGSGKTSIYNQAKVAFSTSIFGNADEIEKALKDGLTFDNYQLKVKHKELIEFFISSNFFISKLKENFKEELNPLAFQIKTNVLSVNKAHYLNSYFAADIAEFIRQKLLQIGLSFVLETMMSHESKMAFLKKAKEAGYRVYLYYVATEDSRN